MIKSESYFYPDRGAEAFSTGCPCCGKEVKNYQPETDKFEEHWVFRCGCILIQDNKDKPLYVEEECPDAMRFHMENLTYRTPES